MTTALLQLRSRLVAALMGAAAATLFLTGPGHAQSCDDIGGLLKRAYPALSADMILEGEYKQRIDIDKVACKAWPYRSDLTLLAVPLEEADTDDETRGDVDIMVIDATGAELARRREAGMAFGDAIRFDGLRLDTARYDIRSGERAFGVVTRQSGSSRVNPYSEEALWLYRFTGTALVRVMDGLVVSNLRGENDGNCKGAATTVSRSVDVLPEQSGGYHDLRINETSKLETTSEAANDCVAQETAGPSASYVLKFADGKYQLADGAANSDLFSQIDIGAPNP